MLCSLKDLPEDDKAWEQKDREAERDINREDEITLPPMNRNQGCDLLVGEKVADAPVARQEYLISTEKDDNVEEDEAVP